VKPWSFESHGRFEEVEIESKALEGNPLGDPSVRPLRIYLPPGYDDAERRYPSIYVIQGLTGQLDMWRNRAPFRKNFPELADDLFAGGDAPAAILVYADCWTSLGGSQFLDSPGTGQYHTYLCDEVVPWVDERYRTLPASEHRGIAGKSSGGYGAMVTPMLRPDVFGGLATHAGDALFEACYLPEMPQTARALRDEYDGSYERFWEDFRSRPAFSKDSDHVLLNQWCMAACYSADEDGTVRLPFDPATSELVPEVWERWLAWDPVRMVAKHADALRSLKAIYIDAGKKDEWFLDLDRVPLPARDQVPGGAAEPLGRELVEAAVPVEAPELGIAADWHLVDEDLRDGPAARHLEQLLPEGWVVIHDDLLILEAAAVEERLRANAVAAPGRRVHPDSRHPPFQRTRKPRDSTGSAARVGACPEPSRRRPSSCARSAFPRRIASSTSTPSSAAAWVRSRRVSARRNRASGHG
jgi:hypothetical protein